MHHNKEFLGVDVGSARVGVARGSSEAKIAQPLKTVTADQAVAELRSLANQNLAAGIVVGLPRNLNGEDTDQTKTVRAWVSTIKPQINLPIYWQDEALTSQAAENHKPNSVGSDAEAAAISCKTF